jgi:hypothetical protein
MNTVETLNTAYGMAMKMFLGLAEDLRDQPMARPCPGGNHAMWNVGHIAFSDANLHYVMFGGDNPLADWKPLFAGGAEPSDDASIYPSYDEVLEQLAKMHARNTKRFSELTDADLADTSANSPEGFEQIFGTIGSCLTVTGLHPMHHRGQLAVIRKSLQRGPLMA